MRLFCFPYGGGAAHIYHSWPNRLPAWVDVCAVQPPGRANRLHESPFTNVDDLIRAAAEALEEFLDLPFAFFGHSIGALISFELARHFRRAHALEPYSLIVSGCRAPQIPYTGSCTFDLPEDEFLAEVQRLNGIPKEVLEHAELIQLMMPLLRSDFTMDQTYAYRDEEPFHCPIVAFGGLQDKIVSRESLEAWSLQTTNTFAATLLQGDHFFIHTAQDLLLRTISSSLQRW